MRTVENPKELFRQIDATDLGEDSYEFHVDEGGYENMPDEGEEFERDEDGLKSLTVYFQDLSSEDLEREAALETIRTYATTVDDSDAVPEGVDTKFITEEDGEPVVYMCDTSRMGYEVISQQTPKEGAYACIFPDRIVKVIPAQ